MSDKISFDIEKAEDLKASLEELYESLSQEWSMVKSQWENLKLTWNDSQFHKFEPRFIRLVETYEKVVKDCEGYRVFLDQQIQSADSSRSMLRDVFQNSFSSAKDTVKSAAVIVNAGISAVSLVSTVPLPVTNQPDQSHQQLTSQLQEQKPITSCPIDSLAKSSIADLYKQKISKIARTSPLNEQLEKAYENQEDEKRKKRDREEKNIDIAQNNP